MAKLETMFMLEVIKLNDFSISELKTIATVNLLHVRNFEYCHWIQSGSNLDPVTGSSGSSHWIQAGCELDPDWIQFFHVGISVQLF